MATTIHDHIITIGRRFSHHLPTSDSCFGRLDPYSVEANVCVPHIPAFPLVSHLQEPELFEKLVTNPDAIHKAPAALGLVRSRIKNTNEIARLKTRIEDYCRIPINQDQRSRHALPGIQRSFEASNMALVSNPKNRDKVTKRAHTSKEVVSDNKRNTLRKRPAPKNGLSKEPARKTPRNSEKGGTGKKRSTVIEAVVGRRNATCRDSLGVSDSEDNFDHDILGKDASDRAPNPKPLRAMSISTRAAETSGQAPPGLGPSHSDPESLLVPTRLSRYSGDSYQTRTKKDLQGIHQQLESANDTIKMLEQRMVERQIMVDREKSEMRSKAAIEIGDLKEKLDVKSQECNNATVECQQLREAQKSMSALKASQQGLVEENTRLKKNLESFKEMGLLSRGFLDCSSPALSSQRSSTSRGESKEDNIRKVYIKTKRQYDTLHAVAMNLALCTQSMDLSNFGDFGVLLGKMKSLLGEEDTDIEQRAHTVCTMDGLAFENRG